MKESFGTYLRELRLAKNLSLRKFSKLVGWLPSNLSNLENDKINPPRDLTILRKFASILELSEGSKEWSKFFNLSAQNTGKIPADLVAYAEEVELMPQMFRTVANKKLTKEQIQKLINDIKKM